MNTVLKVLQIFKKTWNWRMKAWCMYALANTLVPITTTVTAKVWRNVKNR